MNRLRLRGALLKWAVPASRRSFHMKRPENPSRPSNSGFRIHQNRAGHTLVQRGEEAELSDPERTPRLGRPRRMLSTLTPTLLTESDYLDLSNVPQINLSYPLTASGPSRLLRYEHRHDIDSTPFPPHARGFFYFGPRPGLPLLAASLRFRCTPTAHPSSFDDGHDLLLSNGLPWQRLLVQAVVSTSPILRDQLLREGHLTLDGLEKWRKRLDGHGGHVFPSLWLFGLHQRFPVDFGGGINLVVRSPTDPHILHLRIAEVLKPVVASMPDAEDGRIVLPRAGSLFSVRRLGPGLSPLLPGDGKPRAFDLRADTKRAEALRALVGNG
ncbi:hypothetical protein DFH07DRAFT_806504 [Mycena maculata]|uniref:Uncharacterized protein n=1 Tax=Mycena maculata TaxID=230809 RepID=A0AAD7JS41_9AGAR|nr:hypothetical protein DFH07DRAFT_806504 [Mycena maculata]